MQSQVDKLSKNAALNDGEQNQEAWSENAALNDE